MAKIGTFGNVSKVALAELSDGTVAFYVVDANASRNSPLTAFGELGVGMLTPQAAWRFDYGSTVNTRIVATTGTANGGGVAVSGSRATLTTGTANNGIARISTLRRLRYLNGIGGLVRFTAVYNTPTASSQQIVGIGDTNDGYFFGYNGTSFGVMRRRAGVDHWTAEADFNGTSVSWSRQYGNIYQIRFQWLGYGYIRFYVLDPNDENNGYVLVHTIRYPNTSEHTHILNPTLPLMAEIKNTGNTSNLSLSTPSGSAFLEGVTEQVSNPLDVSNSFDASATFGNTSNNHLLTVRNKSTYAGAANRIPVAIRSLNIARGSAGAATTRVRLYRNATTAGALTYADVDTSNSPMDASTTTTTVTSTAAERAYTVTQATTGFNIEFLQNELILQPGDSITFGIENSGVQSTEHVVTVNWIEQF